MDPLDRTGCETLLDQKLFVFFFRPQSWSRNSEFLLDSEDNRLNLVILGSEGLSDQLAREIRVCTSSSFSIELTRCH